MFRINLPSHNFGREFEGTIKRDYGTLVYNDQYAPYNVVFINPDREKLRVMVLDNWGEEEFKVFDENVQTVPDVGYQAEFPRFELDVDIPYGFRDVSWHNDTCPSWACRLADGNYVRIWIDYKDPKEREVQGPRFGLGLYDHEMEHIQDLVQTDDWVEIELQARFQIMKAEVLALMQEGKVPKTVRSIEDLDDHCDTNALGGFCEEAFPTPRDAEGNRTEAHMDFHTQCLAELSNWLRNLPADFNPGPAADQPAAVQPPVEVEGKITESHLYMQVDAPANAEVWIEWLTWDHAKRVRFAMYQQLRKEFEKQP